MFHNVKGLAQTPRQLLDCFIFEWNADPAFVEQRAFVTLGGNRNLAMSGWKPGMTGILEVIQDGTGSRTLTLPAGSKVGNAGAGVINLTATAGASDLLAVYCPRPGVFYWTYAWNFT